MEWKGLLMHDSDLDLFVLHFVSFRLIENSVERARQSWNHHKVRTEKHMTPHQLYVMGLTNLAQQENPEDPFTELEQVSTFIFFLYTILLAA